MSGGTLLAIVIPAWGSAPRSRRRSPSSCGVTPCVSASARSASGRFRAPTADSPQNARSVTTKSTPRPSGSSPKPARTGLRHYRSFFNGLLTI